MSEEQTETVVEESKGEEPQYSEVEQEAMQRGWNPEGVEGKRNLTAEEFLDRQTLYDDIRSLKKANKRQQETITALKTHYDHVAEREREKVLAELKQLKSQALEEQNYDAVVEIDEKLAEARKQPEQEEKVQQQEVFAEWREANSWYDSNKDMREYADMIGEAYYRRTGGKVPLDDVYEYVTKEVKARFPDSFRPAKERAHLVEGAQRGSGPTKRSKFSEADLPEEAREIMKSLTRSGIMTKEDYLKSYFE